MKRNYTKEEKLEILEMLAKSDMSQIEFCNQIGVHERTIITWKYQFGNLVKGEKATIPLTTKISLTELSKGLIELHRDDLYSFLELLAADIEEDSMGTQKNVSDAIRKAIKIGKQK